MGLVAAGESQAARYSNKENRIARPVSIMSEPERVPISEKDFRRQVTQLAQLQGWKVHYNWTELHSAKGWPDLTLCRLSRLVFAELKSDKGKTTAEQEEWLDALRQTNVEVYLWRPTDFDNIVKVLE